MAQNLDGKRQIDFTLPLRNMEALRFCHVQLLSSGTAYIIIRVSDDELWELGGNDVAAPAYISS